MIAALSAWFVPFSTRLYHLIFAFMVLKALGFKTPIRYFVSLLKPCFHETWTHADCTAPALEFQNKSESWVVRVGNQFSAADAHRCFLAQQVHGSCTPTAAASVACQQQLEALANWWNQYASEHLYTQQVRVRQSPVASLLVATLLILTLRIPRYFWSRIAPLSTTDFDYFDLFLFWAYALCRYELFIVIRQTVSSMARSVSCVH